MNDKYSAISILGGGLGILPSFSQVSLNMLIDACQSAHETNPFCMVNQKYPFSMVDPPCFFQQGRIRSYMSIPRIDSDNVQL